MSRPETLLTPVPEPVEPAWGAAVIAPGAGETLPTRVDAISSSALFWLVACHGGAGSSTLSAYLGDSADSGQAWPGREDESPYVVLVARESLEGLTSIHNALRQYLTGNTPEVQVIAIALVAASPAKKPAPSIRRYRQLVEQIAEVPIWEIGWHEYLLATDRHHLPVMTHLDAETPRKWSPDVNVPPDIDRLGRAAATAVLSAHLNTH
ncbi:hypothetical protein SAMN04489765_0085 [Tsukamurella pulmonis]|uniref:Uncharacterized protein n=1 Tax=Tsukamurella pulmonis TaxID=47312 RepID=A0A1H1A7B5_9ACTN|nr:hypothetical protein [Tsukamurella pulmonis]SDQ35509.1 hypothetical protein SAMN04489765_0085 [Tsukamurella pulmonis]SUQ39453.1 Uncharacterised protein [Tsukamurella pulmonis]